MLDNIGCQGQNPAVSNVLSYSCQELRWLFIGIVNRNDLYSQYPEFDGSDGISWYSENQPLHNGHNFSRELLDPRSFVRGLGGRQSRFNLNDDVSAPITFASSVDAISSINECFACDISGLREAIESSGV